MKKISVLFLFCTLISIKAFAAPIDGNSPFLLDHENVFHFNLADVKHKLSKNKAYKAELYTKPILISDIKFENNKTFTSDDLKKLVEIKIGSENTSNNLIYIKDTITNFYQIKGYIATKVETLTNTDGTVTVKINESKNDSIKVESLDYLLK